MAREVAVLSNETFMKVSFEKPSGLLRTIHQNVTESLKVIRITTLSVRLSKLANSAKGGRNETSHCINDCIASLCGLCTGGRGRTRGRADFNIKTDIDLKALDTREFLRCARSDGQGGRPDRLLRFRRIGEGSLRRNHRRFEAKYDGVKVDYHQVDGEQAVQQLIAAKQAGQPSPVDVFWMPNGSGPRRRRGRRHRQPAAQHHAAERARPRARMRRPYRAATSMAARWCPFTATRRRSASIRAPSRSAASRRPFPSCSPSPRPIRRRSRSPIRPAAAPAAVSSKAPSSR